MDKTYLLATPVNDKYLIWPDDQIPVTKQKTRQQALFVMPGKGNNWIIFFFFLNSEWWNYCTKSASVQSVLTRNTT